MAGATIVRGGPGLLDLDRTLEVLRALERAEARYVVVGAVALNFLGLARMTRHLDLFIDPSPDNVERVKRALREVFADPAVEDISATDLAAEYPAVTYVPPSGDFSIDLLARRGEAFSFQDIEWHEVEFSGLRARVATPRMLFVMKKDTVRLQDRADAQWLREQFQLEDP